MQIKRHVCQYIFVCGECKLRLLAAAHLLAVAAHKNRKFLSHVFALSQLLFFSRCSCHCNGGRDFNFFRHRVLAAYFSDLHYSYEVFMHIPIYTDFIWSASTHNLKFKFFVVTYLCYCLDFPELTRLQHPQIIYKNLRMCTLYTNV